MVCRTKMPQMKDRWSANKVYRVNVIFAFRCKLRFLLRLSPASSLYVNTRVEDDSVYEGWKIFQLFVGVMVFTYVRLWPRLLSYDKGSVIEGRVPQPLSDCCSQCIPRWCIICRSNMILNARASPLIVYAKITPINRFLILYLRRPSVNGVFLPRRVSHKSFFRRDGTLSLIHISEPTRPY